MSESDTTVFSLTGEIVTTSKIGFGGFVMFPFKTQGKLHQLGILDRNLTLKGYIPFLNNYQRIPFRFKCALTESNYGKGGNILTWEPLNQGPDSLYQIFKSLGVPPDVATVASQAIPSTVPVFDLTVEYLQSLGVTLPPNSVDNWDRFIDYGRTQLFLGRFKFNLPSYDRLRSIFGGPIADVLSDNPYLLLSSPEFDLSYITVLVRKHKKSTSPSALLQGMILKCLRENQDEGNTYMESTTLVYKVQQDTVLSDLCNEEVETAVAALATQGLITRNFSRYSTNDDPRIFLSRTYKAEAFIASDLLRRASTAVFQLTEDVSPLGGVALTWGEDQAKAIDTFKKNRVLLLSGLPGTGKTSVIKALVQLCKQHSLSFSLLAPTGMAARRLKTVVGAHATTIHSALGYDGQDFRLSNISSDVAIVDEMSMVDVDLAANLLATLRPETRLVLVGDDAQLPSVGPGKVFADLLSSTLPKVRQTKIFRQAEDNPIIKASHEIHAGNVPGAYKSDKLSSFRFVECNIDTALKAIEGAVRKLAAEGRSFQVLAPTYQGHIGINVINDTIRDILNPGKPRLSPYSDIRDQDRVVFIKNNRDLGYYNGDTGKVISHTKSDVNIELSAGGKVVKLPISDLSSQALPGYCISVHRAQGNEYDTVILPVFPSYGRMLQRSLYYTAVTRAKEKILVLGTLTSFEKAVATETLIRRQTALASFFDDELPCRSLPIVPETSSAVAAIEDGEHSPSNNPFDTISETYITPSEVDSIFKEMQECQVTLAEDPSTLGTPYLQTLTARVREYTNRVTYHTNEMTKRKVSVMRVIHALRTYYKVRSNELLSTDTTVRAQKSIKDREAYISVVLHVEDRKISALEAQLREIEMVLETLKLTHRELRDVAGEIRSQVKIVEIELKTKSYFGDDRSNPAPVDNSQEVFQREVDEFLDTEGLV